MTIRPNTWRALKYATGIATIVALAGAISDQTESDPIGGVLFPGLIFRLLVYQPRNSTIADALVIAVTWASYFACVYAGMQLWFLIYRPEDS